MNWNDVGFLISKNKYNENSLISEIYTKNHGKVSGIIFGGTSKIKLNSIGIIRKTDGNTYRISSSLDWNRNFIHKSGSIFKLNINFRGDLYNTSKKTKQKVPKSPPKKLKSKRRWTLLLLGLQQLLRCLP